jgi:hypothetical protein
MGKCPSLDHRKEAMTSQLHQSGQSQRLPTHTRNLKHEHNLRNMKEKHKKVHSYAISTNVGTWCHDETAEDGME